MAPKILCLHGSGTSADIFRIQAIRLGRLLQPHFELVYVDGFIDSGPGPGVLPFFEGMEPYKRWLTDLDGHEERPWRDLSKLVDLFEREGPFVGIIAFSQGAKAATHLVRHLEQQHGQQLDFAALFGGTVPFRRKIGTPEFAELTRPTIITQSIHIIGDDDPWRNESEALMEHYDASTRSLIRFKGGHHMPVDADINDRLAKLIIAYHDDSNNYS